MNINMVFSLAGGLGLFLYGMKVMGEELERTAGGKLRRLLEILTKNRFMGVLVGAVFTMVIQSSSATTVMVVGFVNAGLMNLMQAAGVIMGANIGTTITAQLIALKLTTIAPLFVFAGVVLMLFGKRKVVQRVGHIITGFGILFVGMEMMSEAMTPLRSMPEVADVLTTFNNPFMALMAGLILTSIIQSSSASVGLLQVLAANGLIPFNIGIYIMIGTNIGTCVTALLASIGTTKTAHRAALIHLLFNVIGAVLVGILIQLLPIVPFIERVTPSGEPAQLIANAHTAFNIITVLVLFPLTNQLVKLATKLVPGDDPKAVAKRLAFLDDRILQTPSVAVAQVTKEVERMGQLAYENLKRAVTAFINKDTSKIPDIQAEEEVINFLNHEITYYLVRINELELPPGDEKLLGSYFHVVNDIERISDHAENISEFLSARDSDNIAFSQQSLGEIEIMLSKTLELLDMSLEVLHTQDKSKLQSIVDLEESIDDMELDYSQKHIERLTQGLCTPRAGMMFTDILSNLERTADHAINIAFSYDGTNNRNERFKPTKSLV